MPSSGAGGVPGFGPNPFAPPASQQFYQPQPNTVAPVFPSYSGTAPAGTQLFYSSAQFQTVVIADNGSTLEIGAITGLPTLYPFKLLLEWGTANQEIVIITSAPSGNGPYTFTGVLRGCDGGGPQVTHATGAQVNHGVSASDFYGIAPVFNVCAYGADPYGEVDSYTAIQAALNAATQSQYGGIVYTPPGVYLTSQILQIGSNTWLRGPGKGIATIRAINSMNPTQVGTNQGVSVLQVHNDTSASNIRVTGITFDGNQANIASVPGWADVPDSGPVSLRYIDNLVVDGIEVINAIGYSLYLFSCTNFQVTNNRVISGQTPATGYNSQDGIHVSNSQYGVIAGNFIDTGTQAPDTAGDDAIAIESYATGPNPGMPSVTPSSDTVISGNVIRSAAAGIDLAMNNASIKNISITGNDIWETQGEGIVLRPWSAGTSVISNVSITGNVINSPSVAQTGAGVTLYDYTVMSSTGQGWQDVVIADNSFVNITATGQFGIYVLQGSGLQINNNNFDNWDAGTGIQIGNNISSVSCPVNNFQVSGNTINMVSSTASPPYGIIVIDSYDGIISGNTIDGVNASSSVGILVLNYNPTYTVTGLVVTNNRILNWTQAYQEINFGAQPDYNYINGNLLHGCTTGVAVTGAHTFAQTGIIDLGGVPDTEQWGILASSYTLTSQTAEQKLFNWSASGALTLNPGTYFFECVFELTSMSATSGNTSFSVLGAGTATIGTVVWAAVGQDATTQTTAGAAGTSFQTSSTSVGNIVTAATGTAMSAKVSGMIRVTAAGTIIPSVGLTTAAAAVAAAGSYFRLWAVSASSSAAYAGNWS